MHLANFMAIWHEISCFVTYPEKLGRKLGPSIPSTYSTMWSDPLWSRKLVLVIPLNIRCFLENLNLLKLNHFLLQQISSCLFVDNKQDRVFFPLMTCFVILNSCFNNLALQTHKEFVKYFGKSHNLKKTL